MGAPKLDDNARRHEAITALFTKEEKQRVVKAALARGIAPGILVRNAALQLADQCKASAA